MSKYHYVRKSITWDGHRYEVRGKTEMEAVERLSELLTSLQEGRVLRSGDTLVDIWYQEWKRVYKAPADLTRKSLQLYDEKYRKYISPAIGTLPLRDVHDVQLQSILNDQRGMSFSHVTKLRMVMQEMFRQAYRSRLIAFDPSVGLRLPKNVKRSFRSITEEERAHILEVAKYHPSGLWILLILYSGLRPGEAAALQWKDIDFDRNEIHVYKAVESGSNHIKTPKTPAGFATSLCEVSCDGCCGKQKESRSLCFFQRKEGLSEIPAESGNNGSPLQRNWIYTWEHRKKMGK